MVKHEIILSIGLYLFDTLLLAMGKRRLCRFSMPFFVKNRSEVWVIIAGARDWNSLHSFVLIELWFITYIAFIQFGLDLLLKNLYFPKKILIHW